VQGALTEGPPGGFPDPPAERSAVRARARRLRSAQRGDDPLPPPARAGWFDRGPGEGGVRAACACLAVLAALDVAPGSANADRVLKGRTFLVRGRG